MGLDMYLFTAERGVGKPEMGPWPEQPVYGEDRSGWAARNEIGYWRKANAVHQYFVGKSGQPDDCQVIPVPMLWICELRDRCEQVLTDHSKAAELLPTTSGFFFGSTTYDEWYFNDLKDTVTIINGAVLTNPAIVSGKTELYYEASW